MVFSLIFIYNIYFSFFSILIFEDYFVNHLSVKLISSIKIIIMIAGRARRSGRGGDGGGGVQIPRFRFY